MSLQETWSKENGLDGEEAKSRQLARIIQTIKFFVTMRHRRALVLKGLVEEVEEVDSTSSHPALYTGTGGGEQQHLFCEEILQPLTISNHCPRDHHSPPPSPPLVVGTTTALPYMYLRSTHVVPLSSSSSLSAAAAASAASIGSGSNSNYNNISRAEREELEQQVRMTRNSLQRIGASLMDPAVGDPTVSRKVDQACSRDWEFCWGRMAASRREQQHQQLANAMQLFRPILLYSAVMARNIIATNTYYLHEHIAKALFMQQMDQRVAAVSFSHSRTSPLAFAC